MQLLRLFQHVLTAVVEVGVFRIHDLLLGQQVSRFLACCGHGIGVFHLDGHVLRFVKLERRRPDRAGDVQAAGGGVRIEEIVLQCLNGGGELLGKGNHAHHGEYVALDLQRLAHGVFPAEQGGDRVGVYQRHLAEVVVIRLGEAPAGLDLIAVNRQIVHINAVGLAVEARVLVVHKIGIVPGVVQRYFLHAGDVL